MALSDELDFHGRAVRAFERVATEIHRDLTQLVDKPVGTRRGPRGGTIKIRSRPYEPPRRDRGDLKKSFQWAVERVAGQLIGSVFTTSQISSYLEHGTDRMEPRPHWAVIYRNWSPRIASRIADVMFNG